MSNDTNMVDFQIQPNAKIIDILFQIKEECKIDELKIKNIILLENKRIREEDNLLEPIKTIKKIQEQSLKDEHFFKANIIQSLRTGSDEKPELWGNILSVFEDYSLYSCSVVIPNDNKYIVKNIVSKYNEFDLNVIKRLNFDELAPGNTKNQENLYNLIYKMGVYAYFKPDMFQEIYAQIIRMERKLIDSHSHIDRQEQDNLDRLLLLIAITKYNIYKSLRKDDNKRLFCEKINDSIYKALTWKSNCDEKDKCYIHLMQIKNSAYLKALFDGESYNFDKGKEIVKKHSTEAAVTAIISRNLSHNIGSHVLSYWNKELLKQLPKDTTSCNEEQAYIKRSKDLFEYIQHRMDFVAELSTSIPCSEMSLDIERDIFWPFIRPNTSGFNPSYKTNGKLSVLLEFLAHSEGINLHDKIELEIINDNCNRASIPNGIVGTHAIYSILENFIRNAAKHYKDGIGRDGNSHVIKIVIKEPPINSEWKDKYIAVRIWDMRENSCDIATVEKLRDYMPKGKKYPFTDPDGRLNHYGWGFKEMLASANFLRKNPPECLMKEENTPSLLEILCGNYGDGSDSEATCKNGGCNRIDEEYKRRLGIRFYLRKPKDLAVAIDTPNVAKERFEIEPINLADYINEEIPHRILLVKDPKVKEEYEKNPEAPCRIMAYDEKPEINDNYYLNLYEEFIKREIASNNGNTLPKIIFTGGGQSNSYEWIFEDENSGFGEAVSESKNDELSKCLDSSNKFILYYHHAQESMESINTNIFEKHKDKMLYFQGISAAHSFYTRAKKPLDDTIMIKHFCLELIESALTKIVIIDERVSEWSKNIYTKFDNNEIYIKDILEYMNIFVIEVNLKHIDSEELNDKLTSVGKSKCSIIKDTENNCLMHFFVIHQGVLDKIEKNKNNGAKELLNSINCRWKVVDSGRGVPPEFYGYENVRFVEISALQKMLENYDKHALVQTLFSLRRPPVRRNND